MLDTTNENAPPLAGGDAFQETNETKLTEPIVEGAQQMGNTQWTRTDRPGHPADRLRGRIDGVARISAARIGATPEEWDHLSRNLGLAEDLIPVVANNKATISPKSSVRELGKVPTLYNQNRQVHGITGWPEKRAKEMEIEAWRSEPDYGICVITREVRGLDVDITDPVMAPRVQRFIANQLGYALPRRHRANSSKFLHPFRLVGNFGKRVIYLDGVNKIEFLMTGQQFVAAGTHPSGARIEWDGGLPNIIPALTVDQFEGLFQSLQTEFGIKAATVKGAPGEGVMLADLAITDPAYAFMQEHGLVLGTSKGKAIVACPWESEHSEDTTGTSTTVYIPAGVNGLTAPGFCCKHAHCEGRNFKDYYDAIGYAPSLDDFDVLEVQPVLGQQRPRAIGFQFVSAAQMLSEPKQLVYLIDELIEHPALVLLFAPPSAGKSFCAIGWACCVATGTPWLGRETKQGSVFYLAGEGHAGLSRRLKAWELHSGYELAPAPLFVSTIPAALMSAENVKEVIHAVQELTAVHGNPALIVIDTYARNMGGGDESSNKDTGVFINNIDQMRYLLGCTVVLVHHSGHSATERARGASALVAAMDASFQLEAEVDSICLSQKKSKESENIEPMFLKLMQVNLPEWLDSKGRTLTSAVVVEIEPPPANIGRSPKLPGQQQLALDSYIRAARSINSIDVNLEQWRPEFNKTATQDNDGSRDTAFLRARTELVKTKRMKVEDGVYSLIGLAGDRLAAEFFDDLVNPT